MAYPSSVNETAGFTANFLVLGHELLHPLDLMHLPPATTAPTDVNKHVIKKQAVFHRAFELVRCNYHSTETANCFLKQENLCSHVPQGRLHLLHYASQKPAKVPNSPVLGDALIGV